MRVEFARAMAALAASGSNSVFITGDVGYMALEEVAQAYGERFVNAGIAEQNMVSLAAGLAREGHLPWVYSTTPFVALRPYEQIRNDVCLHRLPVKLIGNGGGYGYGIMGATHHGLEDVGAMRALPGMRIYVPLVSEDVDQVVQTMAEDPLPNYLRLNAAATLPGRTPPFAPWRKIKSGSRAVLVGMGPVLGNVFELGNSQLLDEMEIWSVGILPLADLPAELVASIRDKRRLLTIEEHYAACGVGEALSRVLLESGVLPERFAILSAAGYPSGRYGSQRWHQEDSALAGQALFSRLERLVRD